MSTVRSSQAAAAETELSTVRRLLLALMLFGSFGLLVELFLLQHFESPWQWSPIVLLSAGLVCGVVLWVRPGRQAVLFYRGLMVAYLLASLVGMTLHYQSNAELEIEMDSAIGSADLFWYAIHGATPALAPGALLQLGILGLILVYRHPSIAARSAGSTG